MTIFSCAARMFGTFAVILSASMLATSARAASEAVVYSFKGTPDGANPAGTLLKVGDMLFGTTTAGGTYNKGTVFSISPQGVEKVLWSFGNGKDGVTPNGTLVELNGVIYGTTEVGGKFYDGTVFSITLAGVERVVWNFGTRGANNRPDGTVPYAGLTVVDGVLWGAASGGGFHGAGTIFSLTPAGAETVVYNIPEHYSAPTSPLFYLNGLLYGTTNGSGTGGSGLVFSLSPSGVEKNVYEFPYYTSPSPYGAFPNALINVGNRFWGTTQGGGLYPQGGNDSGSGGGTAYSLTLGGAFKTLWNFGAPNSNDGVGPNGALINVGGTFYGITFGGGDPEAGPHGGSCGTIFSITSAGVESVLYPFHGYNIRNNPLDGCFPYGALTEIGTKFYGTTFEGGAYSAGTVFSMSR